MTELPRCGDGEVHIIAVGLTGTGKSAVLAEIEVALRSIGLTVELEAKFALAALLRHLTPPTP